MAEERNGGHYIWRGWAFDYAVLDTEGLSLFNGFFRGRQVFNKLSLPVIRVKYVRDEDFWHNPIFGNGCGPYNDQISWDPEDIGENLNPFSGPHHLEKKDWCSSGERYICITPPKDPSNRAFLELAVYARIGAYHIKQVWSLNNSGVILPRIFSKGLSCNLDHWHHPYWRFDFDLDGSSNQRVNAFNGQTGHYFGFVNQEGAFVNSSIANRQGDWVLWNVENLTTGLKAWVSPLPSIRKTASSDPLPFPIWTSMCANIGWKKIAGGLTRRSKR